MMSEGRACGGIFLYRREPGLFTPEQVALVQTFAGQAAVAIENVRLFTELGGRNRDLAEALEQQTATSEILGVISRSRTDVQPVFDIIAERAARLCGAEVGVVSRFEGGTHIELVALHGVNPSGLDLMRRVFPMRVGAETVTARAIRERTVVHLPDLLADSAYETKDVARVAHYHAALGVPMLYEGQVIGAIFVARDEVGAFSPSQIELLKTFADQAVIAIENVRLFTELQSRNRDLTESLEQQTATSEILRVISQSPTDVQPVFETIAAAALKLCAAASANVFTFDGELLHIAALANKDKAADLLRELFPRPAGRDMAAPRAVLTRSVIEICDVLEDREFAFPDVAVATRFRSVLALPLLREDAPIGAIAIGRVEPGPFPSTQIALLQTFADQAVIAIENVRLLRELEARTTQLSNSVGELRALAEVGQAVSSTLDLGTVLGTIVARAAQLTGMDGGSIYEYDEVREEFYLHTTDGLPDELVEALRAAPIRKAEGVLGRLALTGEPVQIADIAVHGVYQGRLREILIRLGYRSLLAVPLLREEHLLGGLVVNRKRAGDFAPAVIELLRTFATQSALAIQNARLFREIELKSRQLEAASRHKSEFLANMSHELRTPLNAVIGFSEVLSEQIFGEVNDKQLEYLQDIHTSGHHLLTLINDILDLSKIEAGRMELDLSRFDLRQLLDGATTLVRERASRHGLELVLEVEEGLDEWVGDERKVKQIVINLLSNAVKFTPAGGRVTVRAREIRGEHAGAVEIAVIDTGVGIAPDEQALVFEEFRQARGDHLGKAEGTGLGLALVKRFVELHGGTIRIESAPGHGSMFAFILPHRVLEAA
jgi:signal transduction histidine kinase